MKVRLHLSARIMPRNVLLFLLAIIDTCPIVSEVLHTGGVSSSQSHKEGILQMKNVKVRDTQWPPQSHSASK